jgi:hypothetical protein
MSEYRSFRLFRDSYAPPEKISADYSESEKEIFCDQFKPIARRYRFCSRTFIIIFLALFIPMFFGLLDRIQIGKWFPFLFVGMMLFAIAFFILLRPICPACKRKVEGDVRKFCPECGNSDLTPKSFFLWAKCHSCGVNLRRGKGRSYKIRCCTHCGVFLDGKGI